MASNQQLNPLVKDKMDAQIIPINRMTEEALLLNQLLERMESIEKRIAGIEQAILRTEAVITKVSGEVMPTIEALSSNPMIKALMTGGKFGKK